MEISRDERTVLSVTIRTTMLELLSGAVGEAAPTSYAVVSSEPDKMAKPLTLRLDEPLVIQLCWSESR